MSVQLYISNSLEQLAHQIEIKENEPLSPSIFVSQTEGIKHWLSLFITQKEGIFSNFRFFKPNEFINEVAFQMGAGNPSAYKVENTRWLLFKLLDNRFFKERYPWVSKYYAKDELRKIQLSCKLADLFDQYIVYRTEMIMNWSNPDYSPNEQEKWQCDLWRMMRKEIEKQEPNAIDNATYKQLVIQQLQNTNKGKDLQKNFPIVHVFGLSIITMFHLELYRAFSDHIDLRFYLLNPAPEQYWYDCISDRDIARKWAQRNNRDEVEQMSSGNQLLTAWGKVGQELFSEFFEIDDTFINAMTTGYVPNPADTLLSQLQDDIHNNTRPATEEHITEELIEDKSIQISSNYSIAREVEVLYDYLLHTIDKSYTKGEIEPQDIVVMVPNIQDYIPYIKTVFGNAPHRLPYSIGDEPIENAHAISNLVVSILNITEQEFSSENVLQLLDYNPILKHYGINDLAIIRQAVQDCNIRFGIEGNTDTETNLVGWKQGLERIVFGVAMRDNSFINDDKIIDPYSASEGSNVENLINFVRFVDDLIAVIKVAQQERTLKDWALYVLKITETFVEETSENEDEFSQLRTQLEGFIESNELYKNMKLSFHVFNFIFKDFHLKETQKDGYFRGRITFCTALPMRSIPFKVIAFLGLNSDSFPRKSTISGFDLIQNTPRQRGDRSIKDNDRYLFLEAFLSAKDFLYLSYIGRNIKDNTEKTPSVLIEELLDYVSKRSGIPTEEIHEKLVTPYPLHSYSDKYLRSDSDIYTYFPINTSVDSVLSTRTDIETSTETFDSINLDDLIQFFRHPIKWYFQKQLGIYYYNEDTTVAETELFDIAPGLPQHVLRNLMLSVDNTELYAFIQSAKRNGLLPLANIGSVLAEEQYTEFVHSMREKINTLTQNTEESTSSYKIKIGNHIISLNKITLHSDRIINTCFSSERRHINYLIPLYFQYLFLNAAEIETSAYLLTNDSYLTIPKEKYTSAEAKHELAKLVKIFVENQEKQIPFFPMLAEHIIEKKEKKKDIKIESELTNSYRNMGYIYQDEYIRSSYEHSEVWHNEEEAVYWAEEILKPLLDSIQ